MTDPGPTITRLRTLADRITQALSAPFGVIDWEGLADDLKPLGEDLTALLDALEGKTPFAWLIEAPGPNYLRAHEIGHNPRFGWTNDADAALRFSSKDQCDKAMMAIRQLAPELFDFERTLGNAWPRQHGFLSASPQPVAGPKP